MKFNKKIGLKVVGIIIILGFLLYFLFMYTDIFFPSKKKIQNSKQLETLIIKESANFLEPTDTLYLALERNYYVCGNDASINRRTTFNERVQDLKDVLKNPFYIKLKGSRTYSINKKTIISGIVIDNDFLIENNKIKVNYKKNVYEISFISIKKDTIIIDFIDCKSLNKAENKKKTMKFISINSKWKKHL